MCMFPQNAPVEFLVSIVMVLGGGQLDKGGTLKDGISSLIKETYKRDSDSENSHILFLSWEDTVKSQRNLKGALARAQSCRHLRFGLLALWTARNKFLLFTSYLLCGVFVIAACSKTGTITHEAQVSARMWQSWTSKPTLAQNVLLASLWELTNTESLLGLQFLPRPSHLMFLLAWWGMYYNYSYFTDKATGIWRN